MSADDIGELNIGFIGAGNMAEAIARGLLGSELSRPEKIMAADPSAERRKIFSAAGCPVFEDNSPVCQAADILIVAVKPQMLDGVVSEFRDLLKPDALVVSIAAGVGTERLEGLLPPSSRVVRVMPNTPMMVGQGVSCITGGKYATETDIRRTIAIFASAGLAIYLEDEEMMHAVTALSGSGPAYVFRFVECLTRAGEECGLPVELSRALASGTVMGAAKMLLESGEEAAELRRKVTSPGGTTEAALNSLEDDAFADIITRALTAARDRSIELGGK